MNKNVCPNATELALDRTFDLVATVSQWIYRFEETGPSRRCNLRA